MCDLFLRCMSLSVIGDTLQDIYEALNCDDQNFGGPNMAKFRKIQTKNQATVILVSYGFYYDGQNFGGPKI